MSARQEFVNYVTKEERGPFVSFQIGAGAGFDAKLAGKEWISEVTLQDTIAAYEIVECVPFLNLPLPDLGVAVPELKWLLDSDMKGPVRVQNRTLPTPYGTISWQLKEQKKYGTTPVKYPLNADMYNIFDIVSWYVDQHAKAVRYIGELIEPVLSEAQPHGAVSIQWNIQPFELLGLASVENLVILAMLNPDSYRKTCEMIREANIDLIKAVFAAGADFIFLGAPGAEMLSPQIYEDFIIPDSKVISDAVHEAGGLVYSHICSPIEPFLSRGYYNRMGLDLFETISPPPVGNVKSLAEARKGLDERICTRGNIGLDVLLNGNVEELETTTLNILEATKGYKHMVAASDYLFYDIPLENVKTVVNTVKKHSHKDLF